MCGGIVSYGTRPLTSLNPLPTAFALRQPEGKEQENDQIYATTPRGQSLHLRSPFLAPTSHLASVTCEACGTRAKLGGLASLPNVQDQSGAAAESVCRLISIVQFNKIENSGYDT